MTSTVALAAHLLRRTGFGPGPGRSEALARSGIDRAISSVLSGTPLPVGDPPALDDNDDDAPARWWLARMRDPGAGLHEKLVWFWHGHVTTSHAKVFRWTLEWRQHLLLREHASGDVRDLLQAVTIDPAMLRYLDGDWSTGDAPNENYSRELMELFTLGRGNYTEADVRAGARALSGWHVDDAETAVFDPDLGAPEPVTYLGRDGVRTAQDVVNVVCDHPAMPGFIAARLHRFLVGVDPTSARRDQLGRIFRAGGLRVPPLAEAIVRHPSFLFSRLNRPRTPVEFVTAASLALGIADDKAALDVCAAMGQIPFMPPSVAGWPWGMRWLAPSYALARAAVASESPSVRVVADAKDPVTAALRRASLFEVSTTTRRAMHEASAGVGGREARGVLLLALAIASPEFALA